jgi:hypothetical protein
MQGRRIHQSVASRTVKQKFVENSYSKTNVTTSWEISKINIPPFDVPPLRVSEALVVSAKHPTREHWLSAQRNWDVPLPMLTWNVPPAALTRVECTMLSRRGRRPNRPDSLLAVARVEDHDCDLRVDGLTRVPIAEDLSIVYRID